MARLNLSQLATHGDKHPSVNKIDKCEQIIQGAMAEFLKRGYASTSMDRIATAAGVSKQTLYSYFQDKEALFAAIVERMASKQIELLFSNAPLEGKPEVVLREFAIKALTNSMNQPAHLSFMRLMIGESERFPHLTQLFIRSCIQPGIQMLTQYLASHPELNILDPEATARIFAGSLIAFIINMEVMHGKHIFPMDSDRLIDSLIDLLMARADTFSPS